MKKRFIYIFLVISYMMLLCGCKKTTQVVLTTEFDPTEVFRIEDETCTVPEIMVYMVNTENQYGEVFGNEIWNVPFKNGTVESQYKESVLARLAQIKAMKLYAKELNVTLSKEEDSLCRKAANEYFSSLSDFEIRSMNVDAELIYNMYSEYALANKVYATIVSSVTPEISDDEARSVTVKSLLIKTYRNDENGNRVPYSDAEKQNALKRAYEIQIRIKNGEDFDVLSADYNEDDKSLYSFGRGVMPVEIEEAAYNLAEGEVSDVIETEYGYHLLKCVSNFDIESTDLNKLTIINTRKEEAFREAYDGFISSLTSNLNEELWDSITYEKREEITTKSFFSVYDKYFNDKNN